jgi:hypothetical protein
MKYQARKFMAFRIKKTSGNNRNPEQAGNKEMATPQAQR